jgi:hypothetical protein
MCSRGEARAGAARRGRWGRPPRRRRRVHSHAHCPLLGGRRWARPTLRQAAAAHREAPERRLVASCNAAPCRIRTMAAAPRGPRSSRPLRQAGRRRRGSTRSRSSSRPPSPPPPRHTLPLLLPVPVPLPRLQRHRRGPPPRAHRPAPHRGVGGQRPRRRARCRRALLLFLSHSPHTLLHPALVPCAPLAPPLRSRARRCHVRLEAGDLPGRPLLRGLRGGRPHLPRLRDLRLGHRRGRVRELRPCGGLHLPRRLRCERHGEGHHRALRQGVPRRHRQKRARRRGSDIHVRQGLRAGEGLPGRAGDAADRCASRQHVQGGRGPNDADVVGGVRAPERHGGHGL